MIRNFQIIGEAGRRVSDPLKDAHPEIPWRDMVGMRNRLVHDYFEVDLEVVWDTSKNHAPVLLSQVQELIRQLGGECEDL